MLQKFIRFSFLMVIVMVTACTDETVAPIVEPPIVPSRMSFGLVTSPSDSVLLIRVAWTKATDAGGDAEFYRHTMTTSKVVTDGSTGPLPELKQVNGLVDTVAIKKPAPNDTIAIISKIWSVRRGLQSLSPAEGNLVIIRADQPPPPPDSVTVDTIIFVPIMQGLRSDKSPLTKISPLTKFKSIIPFKHEDGAMIEVNGNTTIFTIVR